jgi:hypothetical protein
MVILVRVLDVGDEATKLDRALRQKDLRQDDAYRHVSWSLEVIHLARQDRVGDVMCI